MFSDVLFQAHLGLYNLYLYYLRKQTLLANKVQPSFYHRAKIYNKAPMPVLTAPYNPEAVVVSFVPSVSPPLSGPILSKLKLLIHSVFLCTVKIIEGSDFDPDIASD